MKKDILQQIDTQFQGMTRVEIDDFASMLAEKIKEAKKANSASATRMAALDGRLLHKLIQERGELVISEPILKKERETYLTRNADRRLFGLAPLPEPGGVAPKRRGRPKKNQSSAQNDDTQDASAVVSEADPMPSPPSEIIDNDAARPQEITPEFSATVDQGPEAVEAHSFEADPVIDVNWKSFPHLPGTPRKNGGTWLGVKKDQKERPKTLGAVWDNLDRQWYAPEGIELELFLEWMPPPRDVQPAD